VKTIWSSLLGIIFLFIFALYSQALATPISFLTFPLQNRTNDTIRINSVFDHSMTQPYFPNDVVTAYTGEVGLRQCGASYFSVNLGHGALQGFKNCSNSNFILNNHYTGGRFLYYDGHPGYDYNTKDSDQDPKAGKVNILAAATGNVVCVSLRKSDGAEIDRVENLNACSEGGHQGEVKIDHGNGYSTVYLHLSSAEVHAGQTIGAGHKIGVSGQTG